MGTSRLRGAPRRVRRLLRTETLEDRRLLAIDLRPGPLVDEIVVVTPIESSSQFEASLGLAIAPAEGATIDVSQATADDQRYAGPATAQPQRFLVDPNLEYLLRAAPNPFASDDRSGDFGYRAFDADGLPIRPLNVTRHGAAADTTLVAPLRPGDRSFVIANASGWSVEPWLSNETRALAWYDYADASGRVYDDYTYTQNTASGGATGLWAPDSIWFDATAGGYRVILNRPWDGPTIAAGTAVRNAADGPELFRPLIDATGFEGARWPIDEAILTGEWLDGRRDDRAFPPGTASIDLQIEVAGFWGGIEFGLAEDYLNVPTETGVDLGQRRFRFDLDVSEKGRTNQPGDFNHDGRTDAADYTMWRNAEAEDRSLYDLWGAGYGAAPAYLIESAAATHGTATVVGNEIRYTTPEWFVGTDLVEYTLRYPSTGVTGTHQAVVSVSGSNLAKDPALAATIAAQTLDPENNEPPLFFASDQYTVEAGGELVADGRRANALTSYVRRTDDVLVVRLLSGPRHGSLDLDADGTFVYTPAPGFTGADSFRYEFFDGVNAVTDTAFLRVVPADESLLQERMQTVSFAMLNYESAFNGLPANIASEQGTPLLSWRVEALPFLGYSDLHDEFRLEEPWNSPHNLALALQMPDVFRSPDDAGESILTRFQVIDGGGPEFYWRGSDGLEGPRLSRFTDGASNSLLFVQSAPDEAVVWTQPEDLDLNTSDPVGSLGTLAGDRFYASTADGTTGPFAADLSPEDFTALATISGSELLDAGTLRRALRDAAGEPVPNDEAHAQTRLRNLAFAALNHADTRGEFPVDSLLPSDDPDSNARGLSWRVELLPFLGHQNLYDQFRRDEPWDSPHNLALLSEMPDVFRSAGDGANSVTTRFLRPEGPDAPFENRPGSDSGIQFRSLVDGTSQTLLAYEAATSAAVPWTKPEDRAFDPTDPLALLAGVTSGAVNAVYYDGSSTTIPAEVPAATLTALVTHRGREAIDPVAAGRVRKEAGSSFDRLRDLQEISLGSLNYNDVFTRYPTDVLSRDGTDTPLLSWRVAILRFMEMPNLYDQFRLDEPWDSPHNLALLPLMPDVFRSVGDPADARTTRIHHLTGPDAVHRFDAEGVPVRPSPRDIVDGSFVTIDFIEAGPETAVPWTKPSDLPLDDNNPFSPLGELDGQFLAAFFDGHVETLPASLSPGEFRALFTRNGGEVRGQAPEITIAPGFTVLESADDTATHESGTDLFHVVLDTRPVGSVVIDLATTDPAVATLDQTRLTFTPANWDTPQRVAFRGVDNFETDTDRSVGVVLSVVDGLSDATYAGLGQAFTATVLDDEPAPPALPGDFNADGVVDAADYTLWRDAAGSLTVPFKGADATGDARVNGFDRTVWAMNYGQALTIPTRAAARSLLDTPPVIDAPPARDRTTPAEQQWLLVRDAALADLTDGAEISDELLVSLSPTRDRVARAD